MNGCGSVTRSVPVARAARRATDTARTRAVPGRWPLSRSSKRTTALVRSHTLASRLLRHEWAWAVYEPRRGARRRGTAASRCPRHAYAMPAADSLAADSHAQARDSRDAAFPLDILPTVLGRVDSCFRRRPGRPGQRCSSPCARARARAGPVADLGDCFGPDTTSLCQLVSLAAVCSDRPARRNPCTCCANTWHRWPTALRLTSA